MPDLHVPGYEYPPYREAVNFKYDVHNGFFQTRIGNDSDLIHFFKSSGPELENALLACLQGADDSMKIEVLEGGKHAQRRRRRALHPRRARNSPRIRAPTCARRFATFTRTGSAES